LTQVKFELVISGKSHAVETSRSNGGVRVRVDGRDFEVSLARTRDSNTLLVAVDGRQKKVELMEETSTTLAIRVDGVEVEVGRPKTTISEDDGDQPKTYGGRVFTSPLPGTIISLETREGKLVGQGAPLVIIEAMKTKSIIRSDRRGKVEQLLVTKGEPVRKGQPLVRFAQE
jgi:biotin carboxyl carrier protein